jgi:hypothetical protein
MVPRYLIPKVELDAGAQLMNALNVSLPAQSPERLGALTRWRVTRDYGIWGELPSSNEDPGLGSARQRSGAVV